VRHDHTPWLLVSKPLRPPLRDGTTVLVHALVAGLPAERTVAYFGDPGHPVRIGVDVVLRASPMGYAPGMLDKARVLAALVRPGRGDWPLHFFFAPNPTTSAIVSLLRRVRPARPVVQTITSSDGAAAHARQLRGLDAIVVVSDHAKRVLVDAGVDAARIHRVYPGVELPAGDEVPARTHRRMLYAGDLDVATADRLVAVARALERPELAAWTLTIACRPKGEHDRPARARLRDGLASSATSGRVELLAEVDDMDAVLRTCAIQLYLADHVRRKVDLPLVLLEGMARGVGLVALDVGPLSEIFAVARRHALTPGIIVDGDPERLSSRVAAALIDSQSMVGFGADARDLVRREFTTAAMVRGYLEVHRSVEDVRDR
jgi:glycosyltransferase involved in cell wall biosynthesis